MIADNLRRLLTLLKDRIDATITESVLEELDAGEPTVAVEWLCDALFEDEVSITASEAQLLISCLEMARSDRYKPEELRGLVANVQDVPRTGGFHSG